MLPTLSPPSAFRLDLGDYSAYGASIGSGRSTTTFTITIGPISDATVAALADVVEKRGRICLYCCRQSLPFDLVMVEREGPNKVRVVGRIVGGS